MKLLAASLLLVFAISAVANERLCVEQTPNQQQETIIEKYSGDAADIQEMKKFYSSVSDYMGIAIADINSDGKEDIFYSLRGGSCGEPVGILLNLGNGEYKSILKKECHSGCWIMLNSNKNGFKDIQQQDMRSNKGINKCTFNITKEQYQCR
jgi:hypothetical protein